jgi:hypothetical protein
LHGSTPEITARVDPIGTPTMCDRVHTGRGKSNRKNIQRDGYFAFSYKERSANDREEGPRAAEVSADPARRNQVKLMKALGIPEDRICKTITNPRTNKPVAPMTLARAFAPELESGATEFHA